MLLVVHGILKETVWTCCPGNLTLVHHRGQGDKWGLGKVNLDEEPRTTWCIWIPAQASHCSDRETEAQGVRSSERSKADLRTLWVAFPSSSLPGCPLPLVQSYSPTMHSSWTSVSLLTDEGGWNGCILSAHPALTSAAGRCMHIWPASPLHPATSTTEPRSPWMTGPPHDFNTHTPQWSRLTPALYHSYIFSPNRVVMAQCRGCDFQNYNRGIFLTCKSDYTIPHFKSFTDSPSAQDKVQKPKHDLTKPGEPGPCLAL